VAKKKAVLPESFGQPARSRPDASLRAGVAAGRGPRARHRRRLQLPPAPLAGGDRSPPSTPTGSLVAYRGPSLARVGGRGKLKSSPSHGRRRAAGPRGRVDFASRVVAFRVGRFVRAGVVVVSRSRRCPPPSLGNPAERPGGFRPGCVAGRLDRPRPADHGRGRAGGKGRRPRVSTSRPKSTRKTHRLRAVFAGWAQAIAPQCRASAHFFLRTRRSPSTKAYADI
jgi:hypothetical protein